MNDTWVIVFIDGSADTIRASSFLFIGEGRMVRFNDHAGNMVNVYSVAAIRGFTKGRT